MALKLDNYTRFSVKQVVALCNGTLPEANGFCWSTVHHFRLIDGTLEPFSEFDEFLPVAGIKVTVEKS